MGDDGVRSVCPPRKDGERGERVRSVCPPLRRIAGGTHSFDAYGSQRSMHPTGAFLSHYSKRYKWPNGVLLTCTSRDVSRLNGASSARQRGADFGILLDVKSCAFCLGSRAARLAGRALPAGAWGVLASGQCWVGAERAFVAEPVLFVSALGTAFVVRSAVRRGKPCSRRAVKRSGRLPMVKRGGPYARASGSGDDPGLGFLGAIWRTRTMAPDACSSGE